MRDLTRRFHERLAELGIAHDSVELPAVGHDPLAVLEGLKGLGERRGRFYRDVFAAGGEEDAAAVSGGSSATRKPSEWLTTGRILLRCPDPTRWKSQPPPR